jgi:hypothetical protein
VVQEEEQEQDLGPSGVIPHIGGSGSIGQGNNGGNVVIYAVLVIVEQEGEVRVELHLI